LESCIKTTKKQSVKSLDHWGYCPLWPVLLQGSIGVNDDSTFRLHENQA